MASAESEVGRNDAERWFARYLREHGYGLEYEPNLGIATRPDFLVRRGVAELVCEVKGFEEVPALQRRLSGSDQPVAASSDEVYGPMRSAVREAARQLKPLAVRELPLVVVLVNPEGLLVSLSLERLVEAMFGNPGWAGAFNPDEGRVEDLHFEYGRDGRLRTNHPYISAVAIVREIDLEYEYREAWRAEWKEGREPVDYRSGIEAFIEEFGKGEAAWEEHRAAHDVPRGVTYAVELMTTGSSEAVPLPPAVFDGPRDRRVDVAKT